ncbi:MAG: glycosyltransferase [Gemmatimonadaceae bacterium]
MTRILHVIPGLTGGGAERQLTLLSAAQAARGDDVHIAVIRPEIPPQLAGTGVHVHVLRVASHLDPGIYLRLRSLIRSTRAEVVQTWLTLSDITGGAAAYMANVPWVLSERSMIEAYPRNWKHSARARIAKRAGAVVANSRGGVEYWQAQGIPTDRITEIPNAVDLHAIQNAVSEPLPETLDNRPLVLFVGRLAAEKNLFVMVDALAEALHGTNAVALLCGTGPLEDEIENRIETLGASEHILLTGHRSDIAGLMNRASLCLAVSKFEGSPNVVLEAMAAGCPLVVSDIAAYRQLLDEESTLFVPLTDVAAIARAVRSVLDNPAAAQLRAKHARVRIKAFTPEHVATALDAVYRKLVYANQ